jgi:hypothetical protein
VQAGVDRLDTAAEGFEAVYVREYQAVVRLAYALSGSRLAAEDIDRGPPGPGRPPRRLLGGRP